MISNKTTLDDQVILDAVDLFGGGPKLDNFTIGIYSLLDIGVLWPRKNLIKNIGIKYYIIFWKRKLYLAQEYLKIINKRGTL